MSNMKRFSWLSILLILAMVMVACGGEVQEAAEEAAPTVAAAVEEAVQEAAEEPAEEVAEEPMEEPAEEPAEEPMEEMAEVDWAVMPGGFMEQALNGDFAGTMVTFDGPFADIDAVLFEESVAPFEEATGIDINYIGDKEFEGRIGIAVDGGNAPDIADFPQPGLLANFARQGHIVDPTTWISEEWLQQQYNQSWLDMATVPGPDGEPMMGGTWYRFNGKSLVWYPKAKFEEAGYEVPETWDELMALTAVNRGRRRPRLVHRHRVRGGHRLGGHRLDRRDDAAHDVAGELRRLGRQAHCPSIPQRFVTRWKRGVKSGSTRTTSLVAQTASSRPILAIPRPACLKTRRSAGCTSRATSSPVSSPKALSPAWIGTSSTSRPLVKTYGKPFLVAGDLNGMFNDRPEVRAVMEFMTTPQSASGWLENGGALATHLTATPDMYGQDVERGIAALVAEATSFRFDASDLMPGEVGAGTFWSGMTDYVSGAADLDTILPEIDASWPAGVAGQVQGDSEEAAEEVSTTPMGLDLSGTEIAFWHVWETGSAGEGMAAIVEEFNNSNPWGISVEAIAQGNQGDLETAVNAAIASGDLPNVTPGFANSLANWHSVGVIRPLNEFIEDADVGIDVGDLYEGPFGQGTLADGSQIGIPIHQSANVLFYNDSFAQDLGFDAPPATAAEFKEQACAAAEFNATDDDPDNDGTGGLVHYPGASNIASWVYAFGGDLVNESRDGYALNSDTMLEVALFLKDLQDSGCTFATDSYPNPEFATRKALFTMSSTAGIPFQEAAFEDAGSDDVWTLIPFPGPDGNQAVNAFGQLIGVVETTPEEDLASWLWIRHFTSPETQAEWIGYSAYFPSQGATVPLIEEFSAENAIWSQGLALSELGKSEPNIPAHGSVRGVIQDAFFAIADADDEAAVQAILDQLQADAQDLIEETQ